MGIFVRLSIVVAEENFRFSGEKSGKKCRRPAHQRLVGSYRLRDLGEREEWKRANDIEHGRKAFGREKP